MPILNREQILAAVDAVKELVSVPEWGGEVYVRGLTGTERDAFEAGVIQQRGKTQTVSLTNFRAKLCAAAICDEDGKRLFSDRDVTELGKKSAAAIQRVFEVAQKLSGLGDNAIEELTGGLEENPFEGSPTD